MTYANRTYFVSSPYRYSKNLFFFATIFDITMVSSPYRYSKNRNGTDEGIRKGMFQVLIGILKTESEYPEVFPEILFQVLIGILKTRMGHLKRKWNRYVSSPYRYSKNCSKDKPETENKEVSSPYRYSKNYIISNTYVYAVIRFQVLIGILKTLNRS